MAPDPDSGFEAACRALCPGFRATGPRLPARKSIVVPGELDGIAVIAKRVAGVSDVWRWYLAREIEIYRTRAPRFGSTLDEPSHLPMPRFVAADDEILIVERVHGELLARRRDPRAPLAASTVEALLAIRRQIAASDGPWPSLAPSPRVRSQLRSRLLEDPTAPIEWVRTGIERAVSRRILRRDLGARMTAAIDGCPAVAPSHGDLLLRNAIAGANVDANAGAAERAATAGAKRAATCAATAGAPGIAASTAVATTDEAKRAATAAGAPGIAAPNAVATTDGAKRGAPAAGAPGIAAPNAVATTDEGKRAATAAGAPGIAASNAVATTDEAKRAAPAAGAPGIAATDTAAAHTSATERIVLVDWECAGPHLADWDLALLWTQLAPECRAAVEREVRAPACRAPVEHEVRAPEYRAPVEHEARTPDARWRCFLALVAFALAREISFAIAFRTADDHPSLVRRRAELNVVGERLLS